jgi:integrase
VTQQGQVFEQRSRDAAGQPLWGYRNRLGGRDSRRVQIGGFPTRQAAQAALERALEQARRERGLVGPITLADLVASYLAQHDAERVTIAKLRWLLTKSVAAFGDRPITTLRGAEIAAWRMTLPAGHRFEATQALRQVLERAVVWNMLTTNPARVGVTNPQRRPREQRPFETWAEVAAVAAALGPRTGPFVRFAAATGLRPGEWIALEHRDVDLDARVLYVRRSFTDKRLKCTKTPGSVRAVPLQQAALDALADAEPADSPLVFPALGGGYFDLHNFRSREWRPAQQRAGIDPIRRVYDLRHTFATMALRAGISTFDLSRYMGASLTMIDRHYGHLARDGRNHALRLLDQLHADAVHRVDTSWTPSHPHDSEEEHEKAA